MMSLWRDREKELKEGEGEREGGGEEREREYLKMILLKMPWKCSPLR